MVSSHSRTLSEWTTSLLAAGRVVFSCDEAAKALGVGHGAFLDAAERLQRRQRLFSPRRGFYVIVPPQFHSWGAPPPSWYIDALMRFEGCPYYVGLLKAAELHGATHQAVMEFQVVADKRLPRIQAGRSPIVFYYRKKIAEIGQGIQDRKTDTGRMNISSPELTALDLLRYPRAAAGLDTIATVLADLADKLEAEKLSVLSKAFKRPTTQRLGHLLEWLGHPARTAPLYTGLAASRAGWIELDPAEASAPDFTPAPVERDEKWRVVTRRIPEVEQ